MARHTSRLIQGVSEAAQFYNVTPWLTEVKADAEATPSAEAVYGVFGVSEDGERYNIPWREVLLAIKNVGAGTGVGISVSADQGHTWRNWGWSESPGDLSTCPPVVGLSATNNGEALVAFSNYAVGISNIGSLHSVIAPAFGQHSPGNMGLSGNLTAWIGSGTLRAAFDYINNRWWLAGGNGSGNALWAWKSAATSLTVTGGWTEALTPGVASFHGLAFGKGPSASDEAMVGLSLDPGIYTFRNAASPGAGAAIDLSGATSMVFNAAVYNEYWQQWLFVESVRGESTCAVMRCPDSSIGSANTADYEFITSYGNPPGSSALKINDAAVIPTAGQNHGTLGRWCWFNAGKKVLATPDMGDTWYSYSHLVLNGPANSMSNFSVGKALGCLTLCSWENTSNLFVASKTGPLGAYSPFAVKP